jgi:hypothetical protein
VAGKLTGDKFLGLMSGELYQPLLCGAKLDSHDIMDTSV